jgi:hypothetical protein
MRRGKTRTLGAMPDPFELQWMVGAKCTKVDEYVEGCFRFEIGAGAMNIACAWRVLRDGRLAVAHRDHKQKFGLKASYDACAGAMDFLGGRKILSAEVNHDIGDIKIVFEGNHLLEVINDSAGHEGWTLMGPDKYVLFAASGGEVSGHPGA